MTAPVFETLLEVQAHDTRLDQLRHSLAVLPARVEHQEAVAALGVAEAGVAETTAARDDLARRQKRLDDEIETITAKRKGVEATLYGGSVTNARELQDLQEETEALGRRISQLEDQDLELMEELEPVEARLGEITATRDAAVVAVAETAKRLTVAEAELTAEIEQEEAARAATAGGVPDDLLAQYDSLRGGSGGIGVARLVGNQCGGCHLTLSAVEVSTIRKHPDRVTNCEECGRLLVP